MHTLQTTLVAEISEILLLRCAVTSVVILLCRSRIIHVSAFTAQASLLDALGACDVAIVLLETSLIYELIYIPLHVLPVLYYS